jgi:cytoskeleton protein RodZ
VLLLLVGALAYEWQQQKVVPQFVSPAREQAKAEPAAEPAPPAAAPAPPAMAAEPRAAPPVAQAKKPEPPVVETKKPQPALSENKSAEQVATAEKQIPPGGHRIVFRTEGEAWLEVKDGSGRVLISSLSPAGTERTVRGQPPFEIVVGNASSVRMTYDGKPVDLRPHTKVEVARLTLK